MLPTTVSIENEEDTRMADVEPYQQQTRTSIPQPVFTTPNTNSSRRIRPRHSDGTPPSKPPSIHHGSQDGGTIATPASSSSTDSVVFRLRVIELDHYMSPPAEHLDVMYSLFSLAPIPALPILRVYGRTPAGQQACVHIHGVFPYLYINLSEVAWEKALELDEQEKIEKRRKMEATNRTLGRMVLTPPDEAEGDPESNQTITSLNIFLSRFGACLERALREIQQLDQQNRRSAMGAQQPPAGEAYQDEMDNRAAGGGGGDVDMADRSSSRSTSRRTRPYLHSMCVVRARSIYGYAPTEKPYIKLSFYEPGLLRRVGSILQSGCILGVPFEVYESHIPFHLQFMADSNVAGMDFMDLGPGVEFRQPLPSQPIIAGERRQMIVTKCNSDEERHGRGDSTTAAIEIEYESDLPASHPLPHLGTAPLELEVHHGASRFWTTLSTPPHLLASLRRPKLTRCALEVDCSVECIVNATRITRQPLSQTTSEEKLVQSLAGLWTGERERRRALKRAQARKERREAAEAMGMELSQSQTSAAADVSIECTPLTPIPSQERLPQPPSNLDKAYYAHIQRVTAREEKYKKRKQSEGNEAEDTTDPQSPHPQPQLRSDLVVTPSRAQPPPPQVPSPLSSQPLHQPSQMSDSPYADLDALLREAENENEEEDEPEKSQSSLLSTAIRDAHSALRQSQSRMNQHQHDSASASPLPRSPSSEAPRGPIDLDTIPSAFQMSQIPLPLPSFSPSSFSPSQHQSSFSPSQHQATTSFYFSQQRPASSHSQSKSPFLQLPPRHPTASSQHPRHTPQLLEMAVGAYVSQRPEDAALDDQEVEAEMMGDVLSQPRPSQPHMADGWLNEEMLMMSQVQYHRDEEKRVEEETVELKRRSEKDEVSELLASQPNRDHMTTEDDEDDEAKETEREYQDVLEHSGEHDDELIGPLKPILETTELIEEKKESKNADPTSDDQSSSESQEEKKDDQMELDHLLALPLADTAISAPPAPIESGSAPSLPPPNSRSSQAPPAIPTSSSNLTASIPPIIDLSVDEKMTEEKSEVDHPSDDVIEIVKPHQPTSEPISSSTPAKKTVTFASPPSRSSSSSLHFERILESRTIYAGQSKRLQYKMQLCDASGTLIPEMNGGIKWFDAKLVEKRQDLMHQWQARTKPPAASSTSMKSSFQNLPPSSSNSLANGTVPNKSSSPSHLSKAAALLIQARTQRRLTPTATISPANRSPILHLTTRTSSISPNARRTQSVSPKVTASTSPLEPRRTPPLHPRPPSSELRLPLTTHSQRSGKKVMPPVPRDFPPSPVPVSVPLQPTVAASLPPTVVVDPPKITNTAPPTRTIRRIISPVDENIVIPPTPASATSDEPSGVTTHPTTVGVIQEQVTEDEEVIPPSDEEAEDDEEVPDSNESSPMPKKNETEIVQPSTKTNHIVEEASHNEEDAFMMDTDTFSVKPLVSQLSPHKSTRPPLPSFSSPIKSPKPLLSATKSAFTRSPTKPTTATKAEETTQSSSSTSSLVPPRRHPIFDLANQTSSSVLKGDDMKDIEPTPSAPTFTPLTLSLPLTTSTAQSKSEVTNDQQQPAPIEILTNDSSNSVPDSRRILTNLYAQDKHVYDPSLPLRFECVPLPSSTVLHILRTAPPTPQQLLDSCSEYNIWPQPPTIRPFYSNHDHWKQHQALIANHSGLTSHGYVAAALGPIGAAAVTNGVHPPKDLIECLPKALPTVKTSIPLAMTPSFESFHGSPTAAPQTNSTASSRPIFVPSIPLPSLYSLGPPSKPYQHAFRYMLPPPTLDQLAGVSKNWSKEIKRMTRGKQSIKKDNAVIGEEAKQLANKEEQEASISNQPILVDSDSEDEDDIVVADLPRPASPKHDESCLLSYSYFQVVAGGVSASKKTSTKRQLPHSGTKSTQRSLPTSTQPKVTLLSSSKKRPRESPPSASKSNLPLPLPLISDQDGDESGIEPLLTPAAVIIPDTNQLPVKLEHPATTPPNAQNDPSSTPASKVSRISAATSSPHLVTSSHSPSSASSRLLLPTTAASVGTDTQRKQQDSQVEGPTPIGATPIRYHMGASPSSALGSLHVDISEQQHLTIMSLEIHACSRGQLLPDPKHDAVSAIMYCVRNQVHGEHEHQPDLKGILLCTHLHDIEATMSTTAQPTATSAAAASSTRPPIPPRACPSCSPNCPLPLLAFDATVLIQTFPNEAALLVGFIRLMHQLDPDIILGWEIQKGSLGYLAERSHFLGRTPIQEELSRILPIIKKDGNPNDTKKNGEGFRGAERDRSNPASAYAWSHASGLTIPGRIILNLWRIMRDELKLCNYSFENCAAHILGRRFPTFTSYVKTRWFQSTIHVNGGACHDMVEKQMNEKESTSAAYGAISKPSGYSGNGMYRVLNHYLERCMANIEIVDQLDLIGRTAELARVFGIKFYSVLDRGSQYRVESMLLRLSKPQNFLLLSISPIQRSNQPAMECVPLIMEPISNFYTDPVVILDFQSLYPSMMIAYNICYSTCLGKVPLANKNESTNNAAPAAQPPRQLPHPLSQSSPMSQSQASDASDFPQQLPPAAPGVVPASTLPNLLSPSQTQATDSTPGLLATPSSQHKLGGAVITRSGELLHELNSSDCIWVSSNGVMFTRASTKQGLLPRLLNEILTTRVMVKRSMTRPEVKAHRGLHRLLNARQFGLKLISNVTYGYTAAGFSGRMPCAEIADAIVQSGRDTLERAIRLVESDTQWKAKVVYGDTDSLFILLPGRTKDEAFKIGHEIAARVTATNPKPVKLQMDKVYLPCCLLSKKRYVGYKYESPSQMTPVLEAKGIETVRRDGCPAVVKIMESLLRLLFETKDLSQIRHYLERQWCKMWTGRVSLQDFVFAKEVRLGNYRQPPLAAVLAQRLAQQDTRATALYAERVPYIIVDGPPQARLVDRLQHPLTLLLRPDLYRLCASYYIEIVVNRPLMRVLDLVGVDIASWYAAWSRPRRQALAPPIERMIKKKNFFGPDVMTSSLASGGSSNLPPRSSRPRHGLPSNANGIIATRRTIDQYYVSQHCASCDTLTNQVFCDACQAQIPSGLQGELAQVARGSVLLLEWMDRLHEAQSAYQHSLSTCQSCVGNTRWQGECGGRELVSGPLQLASPGHITLGHSAPHVAYPCISLECSNQFLRQHRWQKMQHLQTLVDALVK